MAFGFPAYHVEVTDLEVDRVTAREAICQAFADLSWSYEMIDVDNYRARVGISGASWGEKVEVSIIDGDVLRVASAGRLFTQCLDHSKNRRNVSWFLTTFEAKCIGIRRNAQPASPTIDEHGRSPVDRLINDESS
jgi:hypothetical protein